LFCIVLLLLAVTGWIFWALRPSSNYGIVESDGTKKSVVSSLNRKHIVRSGVLLNIFWKDQTSPPKGYYEIYGTGIKDVIRQINQGPNVVKVTFPEGFSSGQIAQRLGKNGFNASELYPLLSQSEGELFPDTYYIKIKSTLGEISDQLKANYNKKLAKIKPTKEQLIVASIIEREAKKDDERAKIAAVYFNRIKQGMKLEADPTVQYGRDKITLDGGEIEGVALWEPLQAGQVKTINSPYNTYIISTLPPGPICNPGLKSIKAAQNPTANFNALYFFHDGSGNIHFTNTFEEHKAAIAEFGL
jgi:UPF0755 protein